jgi:hypothetical protein
MTTRPPPMNPSLRTGAAWLGLAMLSLSPLTRAIAQDATGTRKAGLDFYGFVMVDAIFDHTGINADWLGAARPTQLPTFQDEFGVPGEFYFGVNQTRFGVMAHAPTGLGEASAVIDFDLFGVGADAGQTTLRLRHAYIELGQFLMGQAESPFMDLHIFPIELDYWGPNGMVAFRNVQFRWTPIQGDRVLEFALERPGASGDQGSYADRIELTDVVARFPVPDFSAAFKWGGHDWGYLRLAGMLRYIKWDDAGNQPFDLAGDAVGWGFNLSSNVKTDSRGVLRLSAMYGAGVENYMNDAPVDIGIVNNFSDSLRPVLGTALPVFGLVAFYDRTWNEKWSSTIGWSMISIENSDGQLPSAFHQGQYALVNLLFYPVPGMMFGPEVQYIHRTNFSNGFDTGGFRLQVSGKYNFAASIGGK